MTRLLHLVRHGQTVWHAENRYAGSSDVALTATGHEQAGVLARWAAGAELALVASSDLSRAVETAAQVAATAGLPHRVDPRLREVDFGRGEGLTRAEMAERFPAALDAFLAAPATCPLPGGEPGDVAAGRFLDAVRDLLALAEDDADDRALLVVAHTTVIRLALCALLGLPFDDYRRRFPVVGNTALTTVRLDAGPRPGTAALIRFNAGPHEAPD